MWNTVGCPHAQCFCENNEILAMRMDQNLRCFINSEMQIKSFFRFTQAEHDVNINGPVNGHKKKTVKRGY